ncbi:unnamed protein product [Closterium sp. Naga37s-1]|nr:unnamed protein product [Closterium sp. Naga37s-1]
MASHRPAVTATSDSGAVELTRHQHGKSRVRLGRVWRRGGEHAMVEWSIDIALASKADASFLGDDCSAVVATDTMKNTVYVLAKQCASELPPELFAIKLGRHFVSFYDVVTAASIRIVEQPWQRVHVGGQPHDHGFTLGRERRVAEVEVDAAGQHRVKAGVEEYSVLKTTQSGFEGFVRDQNTLLPDTRERILATTVQATWSYSREPLCVTAAYSAAKAAFTDFHPDLLSPQPTLLVFPQLFPPLQLLVRSPCFNAAYSAAKAALTDTFFGPPQGGVYSPSVQRTLYLMGEEVLSRVPEADSVHLKLPNLHFIPINLPGIGLKHEDAMYSPTSDPPDSIDTCVGPLHTRPPLASPTPPCTPSPCPLSHQFEDDVYLPTSEPHGSIEACVSRKTAALTARL